MKKRFVSLMLAVIMLFPSATTALAHKSAKEHYDELELVLFGGKYAGTSTEALTLLEYASTLTIDQYKGDDEKLLVYLTERSIPGLPPNVTETKEQNAKGINYTASPKNHRSATHRGWDWYYTDDIANWPVRKDILLATASQIFGFKLVSGKYDKQCNSFCALIYYVHLLGDHQDDSKYKENGPIVSLAEKQYGASNIDIFYELEQHLPILFAGQKHSWAYTRMMHKLSKLSKDTRDLTGSTGGINTPDKLKQYHDYAKGLIGILKEYVPKLLMKEDFFNKVF